MIFCFCALHAHHAHVYWDSERKMKMKFLWEPHTHQNVFGDHHHVLFQSHGDSACARAEDGGKACILHMLPEDLTIEISQTKDGICLDFDMNDMRFGDNVTHIRYFMEVAFAWTFKRGSRRRASLYSFGNGVCGCGAGTRTPGTYV